MKKNSKLIFYSLAIIVIVIIYLIIAYIKSLWPFQEEEYQTWRERARILVAAAAQAKQAAASLSGKDANTQLQPSERNYLSCKANCARCNAENIKISTNCVNACLAQQKIDPNYKCPACPGNTCNCTC